MQHGSTKTKKSPSKKKNVTQKRMLKGKTRQAKVFEIFTPKKFEAREKKIKTLAKKKKFGDMILTHDDEGNFLWYFVGPKGDIDMKSKDEATELPLMRRNLSLLQEEGVKYENILKKYKEEMLKDYGS
jgi:hypothetical protein